VVGGFAGQHEEHSIQRMIIQPKSGSWVIAG
jgi:hypothetical protein